jgi:hypothetical protein
MQIKSAKGLSVCNSQFASLLGIIPTHDIIGKSD